MESLNCETTEALRDIAAGEEITCNYFDFDADAARKLGGVPSSMKSSVATPAAD